MVKNASSWAHSRNWPLKLRAGAERHKTRTFTSAQGILKHPRDGLWFLLGAGAGLPASPSGTRTLLSPLVPSVASRRATRVQPLLRLQPCCPAQPSGQSPDGQVPPEDCCHSPHTELIAPRPPEVTALVVGSIPPLPASAPPRPRPSGLPTPPPPHSRPLSVSLSPSPSSPHSILWLPHSHLSTRTCPDPAPLSPPFSLPFLPALDGRLRPPPREPRGCVTTALPDKMDTAEEGKSTASAPLHGSPGSGPHPIGHAPGVSWGPGCTARRLPSGRERAVTAVGPAPEPFARGAVDARGCGPRWAREGDPSAPPPPPLFPACGRSGQDPAGPLGSRDSGWPGSPASCIPPGPGGGTGRSWLL